MIKTHIKRTSAAIFLLLAGAASAQNAALVNGQSISSELVDYIVAQQERRGSKPTDDMRNVIRQELVKQEILKQEALKRGLNGKPEVKYQVQMMNQAILVNALQEDFFTNTKPSDAELQDRYNKIAGGADKSEFRSSHILVETEAQAKTIIAKLNRGAKFADLAKLESKDPGSAANGGDLDWAGPNAFVPEFSKAMVELKKGQYTRTPVKSQFGYHVILVTDTREVTPPPLEQVRNELTRDILVERWDIFQKELLSNAKVK